MEYAGLDLHKSFCQTKICTKEGELIKEGRIKTELRRRNLKYQDGAGIFMGKGKKWLCNLKNPVIDSYLAIYEAVDRELKNAEREIEKAGKEYEEVKLMTEIKGIGVYSARIIYRREPFFIFNAMDSTPYLYILNHFKIRISGCNVFLFSDSHKFLA